MILVGDLNSGVERHNEPERPGDDLAFRALEAFGMNDNGAVQSCCYSSLFDPNQVFDHPVDHVLTKPALPTLRAFVTATARPNARRPGSGCRTTAGSSVACGSGARGRENAQAPADSASSASIASPSSASLAEPRWISPLTKKRGVLGTPLRAPLT